MVSVFVIMYILNVGWPILFASTVQQVYDFNIIALKLAEQVRLPVVVAYDGFFTSHQKGRCYRFENDEEQILVNNINDRIQKDRKSDNGFHVTSE